MKTLRALEEQLTYIGGLSAKLVDQGLEIEGLVTDNKNYFELIKWLIVRSPPHGRTSKIYEGLKDDIEKDGAVIQAMYQIEENLKGTKNEDI